MKYKKKVENLKRRQKVWDNLSNAEKAANKRPGSEKKK